MTIQRSFRLKSIFLACLLLVVFKDNNSVDAFAAKKKPNKKKRNSATTKKGFGAAPPTLEEVASKFRVRLPENAATLPCPCGTSNALYSDCCEPYHKGEKGAETPLRVLQSRYSAFCYRLVPYIIESTHPTCRDWRENKVTWAKDLNRDGMFDSFEFVGLTAGETEMDEADESKAAIEFQVKLRSRDGDEEETVVSERSIFLKNTETNVWTYASGDVRSEVAGLEDMTLNP